MTPFHPIGHQLGACGQWGTQGDKSCLDKPQRTLLTSHSLAVMTDPGKSPAHKLPAAIPAVRNSAGNTNPVPRVRTPRLARQAKRAEIPVWFG